MFAKMKLSHSKCSPREDTDIIFGPVGHFGWHSCFTPSYHKFSVALIFWSCHLHMHWVNIQ